MQEEGVCVFSYGCVVEEMEYAFGALCVPLYDAEASVVGCSSVWLSWVVVKFSVCASSIMRSVEAIGGSHVPS